VPIRIYYGANKMIQYSVEDKPNNLIIIHLSGEFRIEMISRVEEVWNRQMEKNPRVIAFDCRALDYIDSSSIGTLVKFVNAATNKKLEFVLYGLNREVRKIFETARLTKFFGLLSTQEFESKYLHTY
jgi:anti-sigma B factor antagonist